MLLSRMNRLSFKLPAFVAVVIVVVAGVLSTFTFLTSRAATTAQVETQINLVATQKQISLESWAANLDSVTQSLARSPTGRQAVTNFATLWSAMNAEDQAGVREDFTVRNPFELAERAELTIADATRSYDNVHARYHDYFRYFTEANAFYDLFLISPDGLVVYSVAKEGDFAMDVTVGELSQSGIGEAFQLAVENEETQTHMSHFDRYFVSNDTIAAFASSRIENSEGVLMGVLVLQINQSDFIHLVNDATGMGETGETFLIDGMGRLVVSSRFESGPQALDALELTPKIQAGLEGESFASLETVGLNHTSAAAVVLPITLNGNRFTLFTEISHDEVFAGIISQRNNSILISIVAAAVMSLLAWLYINRVTGAIRTLGTEMGEVANSNFEVEISAIKRKDEVGDIGQILVDFSEKLEVAEQQREQQAAGQREQKRTLEILRAGLVQLAEGDLSNKINDQFDAQYESLRSDFNAALDTLSEAIGSVTDASDSIQHGALEISQASDDLSNRTENQAATLEETAAALDELTASVRSAADGAKSVETIVVEAQSEAEASGKVVSDAISAMTQIEESSKHISQIISVIDDIAFQTNLLALNAGVEAARAGDAGKGFAVVASEVRALAQRSSEAAKEIKTLISGSVVEVERGVELVGGAGQALSSIVQRVSHISDLVRTMATGTSEQAVGLGEINIGVNQLDQVTQQNAAMVEEATAASHVLKADAVRLQEMVARFKTSPAANAGDPTAAAHRSPSDGNVEHVRFQRAETVEFTPKQRDMPVERKATGTSDATSGDNNWIDF